MKDTVKQKESEKMSKQDRSKLTLNELILMELMFNSESRSYEETPHIKKYKEARKLHQEIADSMSKYFRENEEECFDIVKHNLMNKFNTEIDFQEDIDIKVFMDILVHPYSEDCLCNIFLKKHKVRTEKKIKMIEAMKSSTFSVYKVIDTDMINRSVTLEDVFTKKRITIIDLRLAMLKPNMKKYYIGMRIITFDDISFQTGLLLPFNHNDQDFRKVIKLNRSRYQPLKILIDFFNIYHADIKAGKGCIINTQPVYKPR